MEWFDGRPPVPRGGGGGAGSFYHLSFRSGSRAGGACAAAAHAYITRTEEYEGPERDDAVYTESDHMPSWVGDDAREYWDAADLFERANGRLYLSADFALPRDLPPDDQVSLAHAFALRYPGRTLCLEVRRDLLVDGLNQLPGVKCARPRGAFYVFPNITGTRRSSAEVAERLLNEAGVAALSGAAFGAHGEGYLRFSYANSEANLKKALERMRPLFESFARK